MRDIVGLAGENCSSAVKFPSTGVGYAIAFKCMPVHCVNEVTLTYSLQPTCNKGYSNSDDHGLSNY